MTLLIEKSARAEEFQRNPPLAAEMDIEDSSTFGLQGLQRESLTVLQANAVKPFAASLALSQSHAQIKDRAGLDAQLAKHPGWVDEYRIVHLIEKSLWFDGRSDFVMQMMRNPSRIPDNPPAEIRSALGRAYACHPDATVWYGVPLFGEETNAEGLPIPLTAAQVREEAEQRLTAAQNHALRMGWYYRLLRRIRRLPQSVRQRIRRDWQRTKAGWHRLASDYRQAKKDAQRRSRAATRAKLEYARTGKVTTVIPEHSTRIGKLASSLAQMESKLDQTALLTADFIENQRFAAAGLAVLPVMALQVAPLFLAPAAVVACDPFLFIELPDEPGKLRMIGHWYWQPQPNGRENLHVHV